MDYSKVANPYDFANPVNDADLFVGRVSELEEISYYLDHAARAPRPISLALLGERASGKTSTLNMIDVEATKRGLLAVRIDLDEDDAATQMAFFHKMFDTTLSTACEFGTLGGKFGRTFLTYLDIVTAYRIPEDLTFCPFLFPLQYAKAMSGGNAGVPVSDYNFRKDLLLLRKEVDRPIVLLFDEGNVLAKSRVHLEKLRNMFMNAPGFMLVLTGTPDLFPVMDDVFSPIVRQFKKITLRGFQRMSETEKCIRVPLEKVGLSRSEEVFDFGPAGDLREIHELTGGRPYEIQLVCHLMFKRVQSGRAGKMELNLAVLEEVRRELETSQDVSTRPILAKVRRFEKRRLSALHVLLRCDGRATLEQMWTMEYAFHGTDNWTRADLEGECVRLIGDGVLVAEGDVIRFGGDDFDKIYVTYVAREQRVRLRILSGTLESYWIGGLLTQVAGIGPIESMVGGDFAEESADPFVMALRLGDPGEGRDWFVEDPAQAHDVYDLVVSRRSEADVPVLRVRVRLPWFEQETHHYETTVKVPSTLDLLEERLHIMRSRIEQCGGSLDVERRELQVPSIEVLIGKVERTANEHLRRLLANQHKEAGVSAYLASGEGEDVAFHAACAARYRKEEGADFRNNVGYMLMAEGKLDEGRQLFLEAVERAESPIMRALPRYNLGVVELRQGNVLRSGGYMEEVISEAAGIEESRRKMACLLVPSMGSEGIVFLEEKEPDLLDAAERTLQIVRRVQSEGSA
jgi:hypothetical protein